MSELTEHQQAAYDAIYERLAHGAQLTSLRGYAGTGKTYLVGRLIEQLTAEEYAVSACAPTHKAAQVLRTHMDERSIPTQTLHAFLGLRLTPDQNGGYTLQPEGDLAAYPAGIVIVDEASMVGAAEWAHIQQAPPHLQWLFVGDPAQLPPVNEPASPVFDVPGPLLREVHRQGESNPILAFARHVRLEKTVPFRSRFTNDEGVAVTDNPDGFEGSALRTFRADAFAKDAATARVLAYRNKTVRRYNRSIRAALYGADAPRFEEGEWLVARETWYHNSVPYLKNSEEVRVKKASVETYEAEDLSTWKAWRLKVRGVYDAWTRVLYVLHEDEHERFDDELERRRTAALDEARLWKRYYTLKERFAQVDYAYASTVHKCLPATALIETEHGPRPIGDVEEGDLVWTGQNRLRLVTETFRTGHRQVVRIQTASGSVLRSSPEHRFLTQRGWVEAHQLLESDCIAFARPVPGALDENEETYLLGYLVGDGSYSYDSNRVDVCLHNDSPLKELIRELLAQHGNVGENPKLGEPQSTTLWVESKEFRERLEACGLHRVTASAKQCPVLRTLSDMRSFLRGLFDADGSASATRALVRLVSTSQHVIQQVKAMLLRFGVASYVLPVDTPEEANDAWVLCISGPSILPFAEHVSFRHSMKRARLNGTLEKVNGKTNRDFVPCPHEVREEIRRVLPRYAYGDTVRFSWEGDRKARYALMGPQKNLSWIHLETLAEHLQDRGVAVPSRIRRLLETKHYYDPIASVESTGSTCEMVDIEVEEDHSFIYRGAIVHNSQGSTFDTVFVDHRDIRACRGPERQALLYVAVTRPSRRLALLV